MLSAKHLRCNSCLPCCLYNSETFSFRFEDTYFQGEKVKCSDYHDWFARGVSQWLDITLLKAINMIKQAVEVDELEPLDGVKFSSSAVDVLGIFKMVFNTKEFKSGYFKLNLGSFVAGKRFEDFEMAKRKR